jgi:FtsH-binding integral membrane protein
MQYDNPYALPSSGTVATASTSERTTFIRKTYLHLAGAVMAFVLLEGLLLAVLPANLLGALRGPAWFLILGGFMLISWLANSWAQSNTSQGMQYLGLSLYVAAEALIFWPIMKMSLIIDPSGSIPLQAGVITAIVFGGLTAMVFLTGADFSWLGRFLWLAGLIALGVVIVGAFTQFSLGLGFSALMILLAAGYILYDTSNVMHHYNTKQHVAASLALFASVALMLWYVMRILMDRE